jgi:hypothetical protein
VNNVWLKELSDAPSCAARGAFGCSHDLSIRWFRTETRTRIVADRSVIAIRRMGRRLGVVRWNCRSVLADRHASNRWRCLRQLLSSESLLLELVDQLVVLLPCQVGTMPFSAWATSAAGRGLFAVCSTRLNHPTVTRKSQLDEGQVAKPRTVATPRRAASARCVRAQKRIVGGAALARCMHNVKLIAGSVR